MASVDKPDHPNCNTSSIHNPPQLDIAVDAVGWSNYSFQTAFPNTDFFTTYDKSLMNIMQAMHAAARLDVGNILPNNFSTNASVIKETPWENIPVTEANGLSNLYNIIAVNSTLAPGLTFAQPPFNVPSDPTTIVISYLCHFSVPKSPGQIFVSVLVATLSMCTAGWGWAMFIAAYFAKRNQPTGQFPRSSSPPTQSLQKVNLRQGLS